MRAILCTSGGGRGGAVSLVVSLAVSLLVSKAIIDKEDNTQSVIISWL